jgi:8-oxo-dGTP pyrophosphatase MutT (NUDIX family)
VPGGPARQPAADPDGRVGRLRAVLDAHRATDDRERSARVEALAQLDRLERPFEEGSDPTHVTASAIVVGRRGVLLHRHRKLGRWMQPGGHVGPGEEPADAAVRECREETGLVVAHPRGGPRLVHLDVHPAARGHVHIDLRYLVGGPDAAPDPPPGESPKVAWVSWEEADARADEALAGGLRSARAAVHGGGLAVGAGEPA